MRLCMCNTQSVRVLWTHLSNYLNNAPFKEQENTALLTSAASKYQSANGAPEHTSV